MSQTERDRANEPDGTVLYAKIYIILLTALSRNNSYHGQHCSSKNQNNLLIIDLFVLDVVCYK